MNLRFESTYKELKFAYIVKTVDNGFCFESTYKELKSALTDLSGFAAGVLSLPIRN